MLKYTLKRLLQFIPVFLGVTLLTFILLYIVPGDPIQNILGQRANPEQVERLREEYGLNDPVIEQYGSFLWRAIRFDFGKSFITKLPVSKMIAEKLPYTIALTVVSIIYAVISGVIIGIIAAVFRGKWIDKLVMVITLLFVSMPVFWFGIILILVFGLQLRWLPMSGVGSSPWDIQYLILPALTLGTRSAAYLARMTRSYMLEILSQDYIRTARAKGISEKLVLFKHALKNVAIPIMTIIALDFGSYLNGAVLTEKIFSRPGIGRYTITAITKRDYSVILGTVLFAAVIFSVINLLTDIMYGFLDPRIRFDKKTE